MPEIEWLRPAWLALLPLGLALALLARRRDDPGADWRRVVDPALLPYLVVGEPARAPRAAAWLAAAALMLTGIALAGPAVKTGAEQGYRSAAARLLVLDVSQSMDAADVVPSRLHRARRSVEAILARPFDGLTGLVVFAGEAFTVTPLTDDVDTIRAMLPALDTRVVPVQGGRADRGLALAAELLARGGARGGAVLLITDGAPLEAARVQASLLDGRGFPVSVLGVGTPRGAPVPLPGGALLTDARGAVVVPALDEAALAVLAGAGGGAYVRLAEDGSHVDRLLSATAGDGDGARALARRTLRWQDQGYWLLPALLAIGALAFRRGWLLAVVLAGALAPPPATAVETGWLFRRADQRAAAALAAGDPDAALAANAGPAWSGAARYRAGDYAAAAETFAGLDGADDHYNRGNALARAGRLEQAIAAYDAALARDPTLPDVRFNRDLVRRLLAERRERGGGDSQGASGGSQGGDDAGGESTAGEGREREAAQPPDPGAGERPPGTPQASSAPEPSGAPGASGEAKASRAAREAMQQARAGSATQESAAEAARIQRWLERIPDDPGGLLRRKFAKQYEGRGRNPAPGPPW